MKVVSHGNEVEKASKAGINDEHIAVMVSTDRNKRPIIEVACRGRITASVKNTGA